MDVPDAPDPAEGGLIAEPGVEAGHIAALRLFDVAYGIDLDRAETLAAGRAGGVSFRSRLSAASPRAVVFGVPPVGLNLAPPLLNLDGQTQPCTMTARLYDFGVVALTVRVPVGPCSWAGYAALVAQVDRAIGPAAPRGIWTGALEQVRTLVGEAFDRPSDAVLEEDYLIAVVQSFSETPSAEALEKRIDLAPLLSGETRPLSHEARRNLLRHRFSYYADDLVVLSWDRAFVYEPRGETDVADVLEVANVEQLEMRYYDDLLDRELPRMYGLVEATRQRTNLLASRRFADLARQFYTLVAEVTELTERVDNALQVTSDVYLARVYEAALELFRVRGVGAAVDRKLAIIRDTYAALYEEASGRRSAFLEIAVFVLIVMDFLLVIKEFLL